MRVGRIYMMPLIIVQSFINNFIFTLTNCLVLAPTFLPLEIGAVLAASVRESPLG